MLAECSVPQHHISSVGISKSGSGSREIGGVDVEIKVEERKAKMVLAAACVEKKMWKQRKAIVRKQWKWKQADWKQRADSGSQQGGCAADT